MAELTLSGVRKSYDGKQVVHGLDLAIADGQFVVIVGPSGCGKSTLLRMIAGLEDISEGEIAINGEAVNELDPADRGCAMVFQNYALYPHMSVRQNMAYPLKIAKLPKDERERRVAEAAKILGLTDYLDRRPAQLSGGQRQRVAMGRAIVRDPAIFLFDEPLSNLDAKLRVQMRIEIRRLHKRLKATSIFVTHDQVEAMTLGDLLVVMNGGHIEQVGTPAEVYRKPASVFVAGFMGAPAMNLFEASVIEDGEVGLTAVPGSRIGVPGLELPRGATLTLGIRPEDVAIAGPGAPGLAARIDIIEELGGSQIAYCALGDKEIAVVLPREMEVSEGAALTLALRPGALHLFDRASGKRLPPVAPTAAMPSLAAAE